MLMAYERVIQLIHQQSIAFILSRISSDKALCADFEQPHFIRVIANRRDAHAVCRFAVRSALLPH